MGLLSKAKFPAIFFCLICLYLHSGGDRRISSAPYISGDSFRAMADHIFDETNDQFFPENVKKAQVVFVKTDFLGYFLEKHFPKISQPFILITHNSDAAAPGPYVGVLGDKKIIAWFAQNAEGTEHEKLYPIPIGIANARWPHGATRTFEKVKSHQLFSQKNSLLYMNFELGTHLERPLAHRFFSQKEFCKTASKRAFPDYLLDMSQAKFVVSPRGNGLDCHRTWEALLMGAYPIVKSSSLNPLYQDLPVLIVDDWDQISEEWLDKQYKEIQKKNYKIDKIYMEYWSELIREVQEKTL